MTYRSLAALSCAAFLLLLGFQNCSKVEFRRAGQETSGQLAPTLGGNGEPFQGKISYYLPARGSCGIGVEFKAQIDQKGDQFYLVKENCVEIEPKLIASSEITVLSDDPPRISYQDQEYFSQPPSFSGKGIHFDSTRKTAFSLEQKNGDSRRWTLSIWVRLAEDPYGIYPLVHYPAAGNSDSFLIKIRPTGSIQLVHTRSERVLIQVFTSPGFLSVMQWHHVVLAFDSTLDVAEDRLRFYVDGQKINSFERNRFPRQNETTWLNRAGTPMFIGGDPEGVEANSGGWVAGVGDLAEMHLVDGEVLSPESFAKKNTFNQWTPQPYHGTYGENGFYLNFSDPTDGASLGRDSSGNDNHVAPMRITPSHQIDALLSL